MMIREMAESEKPREKALKYGVSSLSLRELLAIIIRTGVEGQSALQVADALIKKANGVSGLEKLTRRELIQVHGISDIKAIEILTVFELNKRILQQESHEEDVIRSPMHMIQWLQKELGYCTQEKFLVIYLDVRHHILSYSTLFIGTINVSHVYPRDVIREALVVGAKSMILVHNHPSGSLEPSMADIQVTAALMKAAELMDIQIDDHFIITSNAWYSFTQEGILDTIVEEIHKK